MGTQFISAEMLCCKAPCGHPAKPSMCQHCCDTNGFRSTRRPISPHRWLASAMITRAGQPTGTPTRLETPRLTDRLGGPSMLERKFRE